MQAIELKTMGCAARALVASDTLDARRALDELPAWFRGRERVLSRFECGALSLLNDGKGRTAVDEVLWQAIDVALRVARETDGLVTPTVLRALEDAGYDRSFDALEPALSTPRPATPAPDVRCLERDAATRSIRLPPGVTLDLAGTAKAWSIDEAAGGLARFGAALVEVGGDMAMRGTPPAPWPIAVQDPRTGDELDLLLASTGGVATSGRDHRRWLRAGREQHHVIDPRTGEPAHTDVLAATVIARTALDADVAAKRVLIEGCERGMAWIESIPDLAAIVVTEDGRVSRSRRASRFRWRGAA